MADTGIFSSAVVRFRPKARLLLTLGEEHISSETVALLELVKNAYDADATRVIIRFHGPLLRGMGALEVIDNGHGMSLERIQSTWMELATTTKKRQVRSERRKRRVLGEKGIGRLASSRLAHTLEVVTRRADEPHEIRACFDWSQFDDEEKYLDEVNILWRITPPSEIGPRGTLQSLWQKDQDQDDQELQAYDGMSGTILRMSGLKQKWGQQQFEAVRYALARLISPFCAQKVADDFQIRLELPSPFERLSGRIEAPATLRTPHYSLKGDVSQRGDYEFIITRQQPEQAEQIERIIGQFTLKDNRQPQCGPFHLELRAWDRDSMAEVSGQYGSTISNWRRDLDQAAGISIYRDGFRVLPYGEVGYDWLGLDSRRAQNPKLRLAHNQVVGYLLISADKNPQLRDLSNREGLIEGRALDDLREMIKMGLTELETQRYAVRHPNQQKRAETRDRFTDLNLTTIRNLITQRYPDDTELLTLLGQQEKALKPQATQEAQQVLARYGRLATLGLLILTLIHDGRAPVSHISNQVFLANRDVRRAHRKDDQLVQRLVQHLDIIDKQAKKVSNFFNKLKPFGGRYARRLLPVRLEEVIVDAFAIMEAEIARNQVRVCLPQSETWITVEPTEIQQIIVNLLQNALYALSHVPKDERRIMVQVHRTKSQEVQIIFSDSGPGVNPSLRKRIFEPFFSTKPDGMGLGLAIVGDLVSEYYNGSLELVEGGPLPGATFRITLRKGVKDE